MSRVCRFFSFEDCLFDINKSKQKTARSMAFRHLRFSRHCNVFTLETSFFGSDKTRFSMSDLHEIGGDLMRTIFIQEKGHLECRLYDEFRVDEIEEELNRQADYFESLDRLHSENNENESDSDPD